MITDTILRIPLFFLNLILGLIPTSDGLPSGVSDAISTAMAYAKGVSFFFPIETLMQIVLLIFTVEAGILLWKFVNWIIKKIPFVN